MSLLQFGPRFDDQKVRIYRHKITPSMSAAERGRKGGAAGKGSPAKRASATHAAQVRWHAKHKLDPDPECEAIKTS